MQIFKKGEKLQPFIICKQLHKGNSNFCNQSTFAWLPVRPVTATFQQPLNANCRTTCGTSQAQRNRKKNNKTNQWVFICSKSTLETLEQWDLLKVNNGKIGTTLMASFRYLYQISLLVVVVSFLYHNWK